MRFHSRGAAALALVEREMCGAVRFLPCCHRAENIKMFLKLPGVFRRFPRCSLHCALLHGRLAKEKVYAGADS
jgi:hypothetical protein